MVRCAHQPDVSDTKRFPLVHVGDGVMFERAVNAGHDLFRTSLGRWQKAIAHSGGTEDGLADEGPLRHVALPSDRCAKDEPDRFRALPRPAAAHFRGGNPPNFWVICPNLRFYNFG